MRDEKEIGFWGYLGLGASFGRRTLLCFIYRPLHYCFGSSKLYFFFTCNPRVGLVLIPSDTIISRRHSTQLLSPVFVFFHLHGRRALCMLIFIQQKTSSPHKRILDKPDGNIPINAKGSWVQHSARPAIRRPSTFVNHNQRGPGF